MGRSLELRRFLQGRVRIVESYEVTWHGRGFPQEKVCLRLDRFRHRCELIAQVLEQDGQGDWQLARTQVRSLNQPLWEYVSSWVDSGFWQQPSRDGANACLDGEVWRIQGFRQGRYHEVMRNTSSVIQGSGAEVRELCRRLGRLADLPHFEDNRNV